VPCDYHQTKAATIAIADHEGPVYLRFGRPSWPIFTNPEEPFVIGKAQKMISGSDVTIMAYGHMVWKAIEAEAILAAEGFSVEVINMHTIKPLDIAAILDSLNKTGCIVTAEEHNINGGLGESVARLIGQNHPCPQEFVAVNDTFGESGTPDQLLEKYGLSIENIILAAKRAIERK
jgi:transketolase